MSVLSSGGTGATPLQGSTRTIDVEWGQSIAVGFANDPFVAGNNEFGIDRYGALLQDAYPGGRVFPIATVGGAGTSGAGMRYFAGRMCGFIGHKGDGLLNAARASYCNILPSVPVVRPPKVLDDPFAVWEIRLVIGYSATTNNITRTLGMFLSANNGVSGFPNGIRENPGNNIPGFGVVFDGAGRMLWVSRRQAAGGLTESVDIGPAPIDVLHSVRVRIVAATPSKDATVRVFLNGALVLSRNWNADGTAAVLPNKTDYPAWIGALRAFVMNDEASIVVGGSGADLMIPSWRMIAAPSELAL